MRRVAIIATASGCGKTTLGRALAARLGVPFHELDALHWRAGWQETEPAELRRIVEPLVTGETWVIDGSYRGKLGDLVLEAADMVVWLDLPRRVWLTRLARRTLRRVVLREELWNGNRESLRGALVGPDSLFGYAIRAAPQRRQRYPRELARFRVARLRSRSEVSAFLRSATPRDGQPVSDTVSRQG
ncbi:MAG: AAA family ATPase [Gaiella sp.]|nr:AAA family ATPase [Gaiella sp.]